ncbi:hypothetical protein [Wolbachia endosymbiont (group B) of Dolichovespula media]|uniref:hypothetical protein n=1 Tax=Wolbachia endosymbiont (group B) of Dolichovespula media TaxID=2954001 RepID=UPI0021F83D94|nr:hypothetical protein [Wolbachia endosymbiont (group B) of Dolichovespula media]
MLTNDLSNNKIPAPPPPPSPPPGWKNTCKHNDKDGKSPSVIAEKSSSGNKPRRDQSKSPVQQPTVNPTNSKLFRKKQKEHNANGETADKGSNIRQSEKNRSSTPKNVFPRVFSSQQDNCNSNKPSSNSGTNNSTQSEKGLFENSIQLATEQKIDTPILINTLVGISKTAALKYSIATLLLCISSVTAVIYTYLSISVTLSDPVLFTVIAFVSASVMLSLAAYLINSHLSAINSEKGVDPGRKQSQDLQKAKGLEHSNTYTSRRWQATRKWRFSLSLPVTLGTPSAPTPLTLKNNTTNKSIPSELFKVLKERRKAIDEEDNVQQQNNEVCQNQSQDSSLQKAKELEHSNTPTPSFPVMSGIPIVPLLPPPPPPLPQGAVSPPSPPSAPDGINSLKKTNGSDKPGAEVSNNANQSDAKNAMLAQIKQGVKLTKVVDQPEAAKKPSNNGGGDLMKNAWDTMKNSPLLGEGTKSSDSKSDDEDDDQNRTPDSEWEDESPTPQSDSNKRSESPDSGHESDDNVKPKSTTPPRSTLKAEKPPVSPKPVNSKTKYEASPAAQANNVDSVNSEVQKPFSLVDQNYGGKAKPFQVQSVIDRGKSSSAPFLK